MPLNNESRTKNASKNVFSAFANKALFMLLTFVRRRIFLEFIGIHYLGINGLFVNILTLLSLADLGLGRAMNVSLYKPIAENDTDRLSALLNYYKKLYHYIAMGVMGIGLALMPVLRYIVNMDQDIPHLYLYYVLFVAKSAVSYLFAYKASIVRADQKSYIINRLDIFVNLARVLLQILVMVVFKKYLLYLLLEVAAVVGHNLIVSHVADKNYPFLKQKRLLGEAEKKHVFSEISSVFLYKLSWTLLNGSDNILISVMCGTVMVGLYSNYTTITSHLMEFVALLFTSVTAGIGNLVATSSVQKRFKTFRSMQFVSFWVSGIVSVCLFYLTQDFIRIWLGDEKYVLSGLTLTAIVLDNYLNCCMRPVWTFREGTGMYRQIRYIMFTTALANIGLSILLGKFLSISGILFATSIARLSTYLWYEPRVLYNKFFDMPGRVFYLSNLKNFLLVLLCAGICWFPMTYIPWGQGLLAWLGKAAICLAVVNAVYFVRHRKSPEFLDVFARVRRLFGGGY